MLTFCQLIPFIQRNIKKKLLTTNYTLSTLPKTIASFILKMELFLLNSLFSYERKSLLQLMSVSHDPIFLLLFRKHTKKRLSKVAALNETLSSRTMRLAEGEPQNKNCLPFQHYFDDISKKKKERLSKIME